MLRSLLPLLFASGVMAITSPMPYRPGYGLGSWIPQEVVESMKAEAAARSIIVLAGGMLNDVESLKAEMALDRKNSGIELEKIKPLEDKLKEQKNNAWEAKLNAYETLWDQQKQQIDQLKQASTSKAAGGSADTGGAFTTFASSVESPIDWSQSKIIYTDRGSDSISSDSKFFKMRVTEQGADSQAHAENIANSIDAAAGGFWGSNSAISNQVSAQVTKKFTSTAELDNVQYTLLLTSFATHRYVRQFDKVSIDADKLLDAWNFYNNDDAIPNPVMDPEGFKTAYQGVNGQNGQAGGAQKGGQAKDADKYISLCTELYLGSALVGMVHFSQDENTQSTQNQSTTEYQTQLKFKEDLMFEKFTGDTSFARNTASKLAAMRSSSTLNTHFSLTNLGYIPTLKSQIITQTVQKFKDFDPAKFDAGQVMPEAAQGAKQSNMASVIKATLMGLQQIQDTASIMDEKTFMDAFDDYAQAAKTNKGMGMPIGMNVERFNKAKVLEIVGKRYIPQRVVKFIDEKDTPAPAPANK